MMRWIINTYASCFHNHEKSQNMAPNSGCGELCIYGVGQSSSLYWKLIASSALPRVLDLLREWRLFTWYIASSTSKHIVSNFWYTFPAHVIPLKDIFGDWNWYQATQVGKQLQEFQCKWIGHISRFHRIRLYSRTKNLVPTKSNDSVNIRSINHIHNFWHRNNLS